MRARGLSVHLRLADVSVLHADVEAFQQFFSIHGCFLGESLHKHASPHVLPNVQISPLSRLVEQIDDLLIVELVVWTGDNAFSVCHPVDSGKKFSKGALHHSAVVAHHREGLAWASLSIDKDAAVVAFESVGQQFFAHRSKHLLLLGVRPEDAVKGEAVPLQFDLAVSVDHRFVLAARTDANYYLDAVIAALLVH